MCQREFVQLNMALVTTLVLVYTDLNKPFILEIDASDTGISTVLSQEVDGLEWV